jgi:hypothetical protein
MYQQIQHHALNAWLSLQAVSWTQKMPLSPNPYVRTSVLSRQRGQQNLQVISWFKMRHMALRLKALLGIWLIKAVKHRHHWFLVVALGSHQLQAT